MDADGSSSSSSSSSSCALTEGDAAAKRVQEAAGSLDRCEKTAPEEMTRASMRGDHSMGCPVGFTAEAPHSDHGGCSESKCVDGDALFQLVEACATNILRSQLKHYRKILSPHLGAGRSEREGQDEDDLPTEVKQDSSASEGALKITLHVLQHVGQKDLADVLEKYIYGELDVCQRKLRQKLKRFEYIYEGVAQHGNQTLLNKVYTELYITEGSGGAVNSEHEVRQVEAAARRRATEDKPIKCEDIFKALPGQERFIRTVLTKGISGIGKTVSVQKFNLEWAEGRVNQDLQLLINLPFRELNLMQRNYSLTQLFHHFLEEAEESGVSNFGKYKLVLIFDGLDECRLPLDFRHNEPCASASEPAPVDVLLTNLINGNLLPSAHIWITSRPAAAERIPAGLVDRVTEIRGFDDPQKEEYFRKKISDQSLASRVISHVKSTRSLYIMCHIPVFSWISATVLQKLLEETDSKSTGEKRGRKEMPKTLTEMYTHFLVYNTRTANQKYSDEQYGAERPCQANISDMILKLGKLAFEHLMKGNMIFYKKEVDEYSINIDEAAIYSGIFTQISKDFGLHRDRVYCFVHLSVQEYFAALYVFHTFTCSNQNLLEPCEAAAVLEASCDVSPLLRTAVDKALQSSNGQLDLFLRFLLGLSQTSTQALLNSVFATDGSISPRNEETAEYIKEKINQGPSTERCINLFHCLSELSDQGLLEEIQKFLSSGRLPETLSTSQWAALVFELLTSKEEWEEFDLRKYSRSEEGLQRLLPVIQESRVALLNECNLTGKCCDSLAATLSSSCLKELDLSDNDLQDSGIEQLCVGLASPTCQLEKLRLMFCGVTEFGCDCLATALRSNPTHLKELDLRYNYPGQVGADLLNSVQTDTKILTIRLDGNAECYLKSALKKYWRDLTLDLNTAHSQLSISGDNKTMTRVETAQPHPDGPERFTDWGQVLCTEGLSGRCYWEAEWTGDWTGIGVAYRGISRKAKGNDSVLGYNDQSWSLRYCHGKYTAWYNKSDAAISVPYFRSKRVGVFLDWSAGTVSFYALAPRAMTHLYTFHAQFSEPLFAGFRLGFADSTLTLLQPKGN